ncbi:hypothetical protein BKA64DRAFT_747161 [Cadophora sp. MPI-SDFR-AT-0126]|nr:hypothetical protein BKA64DRAFT_747161 [Leotiomycetes sp. MPI-SDFR-AT-0126]
MKLSTLSVALAVFITASSANRFVKNYGDDRVSITGGDSPNCLSAVVRAWRTFTTLWENAPPRRTLIARSGAVFLLLSRRGNERPSRGQYIVDLIIAEIVRKGMVGISKEVVVRLWFQTHDVAALDSCRQQSIFKINRKLAMSP